MKIDFCKYEGAGNDFVIIDNRNQAFIPEIAMVSLLCDRHFGVGADGLILFEKDETYDFAMRYFNADGKEGTMCGNGGRCIAWFAKNSGIDKNEFSFRAIDGLHQAIILNKNGNECLLKLKMNNVTEIHEEEGNVVLDSGSPHILIPVESIDAVDVYNQGREIRNSALFKEDGINVNFVEVHGNEILIRTYERGVENETLACGTGAVAAAISAMFRNDELISPLKIKARGGNLKVYAGRGVLGFEDIWLEGPARFVFKGEINL